MKANAFWCSQAKLDLMLKQILRGIIGGLALVFANVLAMDRAAAIEIRCIEASRYKYLLRMFDNDRGKFAEFLGVRTDRLPDPQACRAVIITGTIGPVTGDIAISDALRDVDKLIGVVARNNGWLANLYLASPGGNQATGMLLGELVRILWLKTNAIDSNVLEYLPDFGTFSGIADKKTSGRVTHRPSEPINIAAAGWLAYVRATRRLSRIRLPSNKRKCASACMIVHVGGIDRQGIVYVHRPRAIRRIRAKAKSLDVLQAAVSRALDLYIAYLEHLDSGMEVIQRTQSTPATRVRRAISPRFPQKVSDLINLQCEADVSNLERQETYTQAALVRAIREKKSMEVERLRSELAHSRAQRSQVEICIDQANERRRLSNYAKYCSRGSCRREVLLADLNRQLSAGVDRYLAERGDAWGQAHLGLRYHTGEGVSQDYAEAAKWYRKAAEQGDAMAQTNLGYMYCHEQGVSQDYAEAVKWFRKAAVQGYAMAQNNLGAMYHYRQGVSLDYAEAVKWYRKAAEQGLALAQRNLGNMYTNGYGVEQNYVQAYMWYSLAIAQGEKTAATLRDLIAEMMTPAQIAEAQKLARAWKAKREH